MAPTRHRSDREIPREQDLSRDLLPEIDTPEWHEFLNAPGQTTFAYDQDGIRFTARRERQGRYWYAYKRCAGRLHKVYLGRTADVSRARLAQASREFARLDSRPQTADLGAPPAETTSFVGRGREIRDLKRHLENYRLVTLTGFGGIGKTRLALRLAREVLAEFPDGVRFADLSPLTDPRAVLPEIARTLGLRNSTMHPSIEQLRTSLRDRKLLLILDNCERVLDTCAEVAEGLLRGCPRLRVLTTSREPLNVVGELRFEVTPLPVPKDLAGTDAVGIDTADAIRLFMDRAQAIRPGFRLSPPSARSVVQICRFLDGIPLALELAAASLGGLSTDALATQLAQRIDLAGKARARPSRQQTLGATLDWSYQLLSERQRWLLHRLSLFAGGWTLEAAEEICADEHVERGCVRETLVQLVDRSLVVVEHRQEASRYRLLQLVREYASDLLERTGQSFVLRKRHRDYYLRLATQPVSPQWSQIRKQVALSRELENLRAALAWSANNPGEVEDGLCLAYSVRLVWMTGMRHEGVAWLSRLLSQPVHVAASVRARALMWCGHLAALAGDPGRGREMLEDSVRHWRAINDRFELGEALAHLGTATTFDGDASAAIGILEEALPLSRETCNGLAESHALFALGDAWLVLREYGRAETVYREAIDFNRRIGGDGYIARCLFGLGTAALKQDNLKQAAAHCLEGLEIFRRASHPEGIVEGTETLAWVAIASGSAELGATLLGALEAASSRCGFSLLSGRRHWHLDAVEAAQYQLGPSAFARAWDSGSVLTLDQAASRAAGFARRLTGVRLKAGTPQSVLSAREAEVALLVARGRTNAEIANELVISARTAASHVSSILNKLGLARRAQISTWIAQS